MDRSQTGSADSGARPSLIRTWAPPCTMAILIFLFSSAPGSSYPSHPDSLNYLAHFIQFALLGFFLARSFQLAIAPGRISLTILTIALCTIFGLLDEAHQFLVPERVFDLMDLGFDFLGAVAGTGSFVLLGCKAIKSAEPASDSGGRNE